MEKQLLVGFYKEKITPPMGCRIPGYFSVRISDGIITDLYMHATVFDDGEKKAVFFSVDSQGVLLEAYQDVRAMIAEKFGFDEDAVFIHSTHSHTSFRIIPPTEGANGPDELQRRWVYQKFCDCVHMALKDMQPAKIKIATGEVKDIAYVRRYRMKDGSCKTNPPVGDPDIVSFEGEQDNSVQLIRIMREDGKEILMVNFATHADTVGGTEYCADWPGYTRDVIRGALGCDTEVMMLVGTEGDSNHCNRFLPKGTPMKGLHYAKKIGRVLGGEVLKIYDSAKDVSAEEIAFERTVITVGYNPYDPADLPEAREICKLYDEIGTNKDPVFEKFKLSVPEARRMCKHADNPVDSYELPLSGLRVGDIAFVGFPGEPFCQIGMDVKKQSPFAMTVCTCMTNGGLGYYPSAAAFAEAGYERSTSPFAHDVADKLVNGATTMLKDMK